MVPVIGNAADGINATWHLAEGNYLDAALSSMALIPGIGQAVTLAKANVKAALRLVPFNSLDEALVAVRELLESWRILRRSADDALEVGPGLGGIPTGNYQPVNLGQSYGTAVVVPRPPIGIASMSGAVDSSHALNRAIQRGTSPDTILQTIREPAVVLQQTNGRFLYLSEVGAVAMDSSGNVVTVWNRSDFNTTNERILSDALGLNS